MARIRCVKPEFWTAEQVMELTMDARLMFIGLWNFCDDAGIHPAGTKTLKAEVFPSDDISASDVRRMVDECIAQGLLIEYQVEGKSYWQVTGWHHQKIEKPTYKYPTPDGWIPEGAEMRRSEKIKARKEPASVRGVFAEHLPNTRQSFAECSPPEWKGKEEEGKGEEKPYPTPALPAPRPKKAKNEKTPFQIACREVLDKYASAFEQRYGALPVFNAELYSKIQQLVKKLGHDESPLVASYFVSINNEYYLKRGHDIGVLVADATKVRTEWITGRTVTATQARQADRTQSNANAADEAIRILEAQGVGT